MSDRNTEASPIDIASMEFVPIEELFAHFLPDLPIEADADSNNGGMDNATGDDVSRSPAHPDEPRRHRS